MNALPRQFIVPVPERAPSLKDIPATDGVMSRLHAPRPLASKKTKSVEPGTEAPPAPPEDRAQFAMLFQLDATAEIQYFSAT